MIALRVIHSLHGEKLASFPAAASQFEEDDAIDTWSNIFGAKKLLLKYSSFGCTPFS